MVVRRNAKGQYVKHKKGRSKGKKKGSGLFGIHFNPLEGDDWKGLGKAKTWHKIFHPKPPGWKALRSIANTVTRNGPNIATSVLTHGTPLAGPMTALSVAKAVKNHFGKKGKGKKKGKGASRKMLTGVTYNKHPKRAMKYK